MNRDLILSHLRQQKIKLWLPPYHSYKDTSQNNDALHELASSLLTTIQSESHDSDLDKDGIYKVLIELQSPAVEKYISKHSVDLKIVGVDVDVDELPSEVTNNWGDSVSIHKNGTKFNIRVVNVSPGLTVETLFADLSQIFNGAVRMIYRGKSLASSTDCLRTIINETQSSSTKKEILCLISPGKPQSSPAAASKETQQTTIPRTDETIIASIRTAAQTLQNSSSSQFEITDQSGQLVSMSKSDSTAFLTALGLHRLGRSKMESSREDSSVNREYIASALTFLLEADGEWSNSQALTLWMGKVDNYGLLQLDIAWCYLLLGSLDNLPDAVQRLDKAETVLRKQVHSNFVTLALAQADMGNAIPPLCSVFVRLFLLQGVAYMTLNDGDKARERLEWAKVLCQQLRMASPSNMVNELCNVYNMADRSVVIAVLRKSNGNPDEAGNLIAAGREEERSVAKKRRRQRKIGQCSNGADWINLDHVSSLAGLLGISVNDSNHDTSSDEEDEGQSMSTSIVTGLLRLTNNSIDKSLQMYNQFGADAILQRVDELDNRLGRKKRPRENDAMSSPKHKVQEVDLAMLMSMGVEESQAREAMRATGNVDAALVWLSTVDDNTLPASYDDAPGDIGTNASERTEPDNSMIEAEELLKNELRNVLSSKNLENEWLGIELDDEWALIEKYTSSGV